jgi:hypothetical protein
VSEQKGPKKEEQQHDSGNWTKWLVRQEIHFGRADRALEQ